MKLNFELLKETKTCYRFECREGDTFTTLYLKKSAVDKDGINAKNGIIVNVEELLK